MFLFSLSKEVLTMHMQFIEQLTGQQLRKLPILKQEDDIYTESGIEQLEEEDEISLVESAFMQGYLNGA